MAIKRPRLVASLEAAERRTKHSLFVRLIAHLQRPLSMLDVGGTREYWQQVGYTELGDVHIVLLNTFPQDNLPAPFSSVVGDARDLSRYADNAFDVVFSNSTLGHVGSALDQQRMATEIRRVGKRYFVQTPNHGFPIDWRTLVPFFHFCPVSFQAWCFQRIGVGVYPRVGDPALSLHLATRVRNVRRRELGGLFPSAEIVRERFLGFTKSFVVHSGFSNAPARSG